MARSWRKRVQVLESAITVGGEIKVKMNRKLSERARMKEGLGTASMVGMMEDVLTPSLLNGLSCRCSGKERVLKEGFRSDFHG